MSAEEARNKGNDAFRNEDFDDAIKFYSEAIELDPTDTLALSNRSVTYSRLKKYNEALEDAKKVTEIQPDWSKAFLRLGVAYYNLDKKEESLEALSKGLKIDPDDPVLKRNHKTVDHAIKREKGIEIEEEKEEEEKPRFRWWSEPKKVVTETHRKYTSKNGVTLEVCTGDITKEEVDAIVNAANNGLMLGGGVAGAIERAGGSKIQEECDVWTDLYGRVSDGQCGLSTGGDMPCKYVIHAVGPVWSDGHRGEDDDLLFSVYNSLIMANDLQLTSISFPGISSGIFGFPKERCAKIMFHAFFQYVKNFPNSTIKSVRFTNFDSPTVNVFVDEFDDIFGGEKEVKEDENKPPKVKDESGEE